MESPWTLLWTTAMATSIVQAGGGAAKHYFRKLNGQLLSCTQSAEPSISLPSSLDCARRCLAEVRCIGFNQNADADGGGRATAAGAKAGAGAGAGAATMCSICTPSAGNNNSLVIGRDGGWFYWRVRVVWTEPDVPLKTHLAMPTGLYAGQVLSIRGIPTAATKMRIDLYDSSKQDVALRMAPTFEPVNNSTIRRTSFRSIIDGEFGEYFSATGYFPYQVGKPFEFTVFINQRMYTIYLNGKHLIDYVHVYKDIGDIRYVYVTWDVRITRIEF